MAKRLGPNVIMTVDEVEVLVRSINGLVSKQVLVGIPESNAERNDEESADINNASLGYIHEFGSPASNIPARPFLIPGVRKAAKSYMPQLRAAADAAISTPPKTAQVGKFLTAAGVVAARGAVHEIETGDFIPLKPSTVANRWRQRDGTRGVESRRESEKEYLALVAGKNGSPGMSPADAQAATGIHPLVNTGQLRNAITSVVVGTQK